MGSNVNRLMEMISREISELKLDRQPAGLYLPVSYCMDLGGKRIRPLMTLLGCELFGGEAAKALPAAIGLELFHNFTLMHDDIMDNAPIRRGKPSVHIKWNTNTAILSGDVMFALAYQYMLNVPDNHLRPVLELFNNTVLEVCEGQQYDMNFETADVVTESEYMEMIRLKTAVLPAACLKTGALIAGAVPEDAAIIYQFGQNIGMAFQLKDDLLDVFGDESLFGKKSGGDIVANKKTWLYIKAFDIADPAQKQVLIDAFSGKIIKDEEKIRVVKQVYKELTVDAMAMSMMKEYHDRAYSCLDRLDISASHRQDLILLTRGLLERET